MFVTLLMVVFVIINEKDFLSVVYLIREQTHIITHCSTLIQGCPVVLMVA